MDFPASRADRTHQAKVAAWPVCLLFLLSAAVSAQAQMRQEQAWELLESGQSEDSVSRHAAAVSALGLLLGNARAAQMSTKALQDKDPRVRAAAASLRLSTPSQTSIDEAIR